MENLNITNVSQLRALAVGKRVEVKVAERSGHRANISVTEACDLFRRVIRNCDTMTVQVQSTFIIITIV